MNMAHHRINRHLYFTLSTSVCYTNCCSIALRASTREEQEDIDLFQVSMLAIVAYEQCDQG